MPSQIMPSEPDLRSNRADEIAALEADARLREEIRLLGRILGDTVRDQEGVDVFDLVERIRQTSIRFHRDEDRVARRELELILDSMSTAETVRIVRAFSYFSHLANIAEDQNNIRQMRAQNSAGNVGTLARTLAHAREAGISADQLRQFFGTAQVSPVLTAHPTEVRRKSTIDREMEIAALLDRRERMHLTAEEFEASEEQLRRAVLTLWQTNLLAPDQADRAGRGRQRAVVLRLHLPARGAAAALRAGGPAARRRRTGRQGRARRAGVVPAHGQLDRRRPRRQPVRHRGGDARHAAPAGDAGAAVLSRGAACAGRRIVAGRAPRRRLRRVANAGRAFARPIAASQRRALSPGGIRHLCPARRDRAEARRRNQPRAGRRGRALCQCKGVQGRSRYSRPLADREQFAGDRARPAALAAPGGGLLRIPSRQPRHQAEFRRARTHHRRIDRRGLPRHVLSGA